LTREKLQTLLTLLLELEDHERPNYIESERKWKKWLKYRNDIIGNPSDHPMYPYKTLGKDYYEQLGNHIYQVIQHLKFHTDCLKEDK